MPGSQWNMLRATWAVNQVRPTGRGGEGKTLWELMVLAGWTNPQTAMRYVKIARAAGME